MPVLTGVDAVHNLRESSSNAIFVFLTVHSEEVFIKACLEAGALGYVQEPCMKRLFGARNTSSAGRSSLRFTNQFQPTWQPC